MSVAEATTTATPSAERTSAFRWITGGLLVAAVLAAVAIAVWPASEADKARADGRQLGEAVNSLYYADSQAEVEAALADIDQAVADAREHAGDAVAQQAADQEDALSRAADGFVGSITADDEFDAELYQTELDYALDDLASQASDFRAEGPEVHQAYWEGVDQGLSGN